MEKVEATYPEIYKGIEQELKIEQEMANMDENTTEEANKKLCKANPEQLFKDVATEIDDQRMKMEDTENKNEAGKGISWLIESLEEKQTKAKTKMGSPTVEAGSRKFRNHRQQHGERERTEQVSKRRQTQSKGKHQTKDKGKGKSKDKRKSTKGKGKDKGKPPKGKGKTSGKGKGKTEAKEKRDFHLSIITEGTTPPQRSCILTPGVEGAGGAEDKRRIGARRA